MADMAESGTELRREDSMLSRATTENGPERRLRKRSMCDTLIIVYVVVVAVAGFVLSFSHFLTGEGTGSGLYLSIYHIVLYGVSLLFLLYVQLSLLCCQHGSAASSLGDDDGVPEISIHEDGSGVINLNSSSSSKIKEAERTSPAPVADEDQDGDVHNGDLDRSSMGELPLYETYEADQKYTHDGTGLNMFLLLGLIVFSLGAIILDAFRLLQFIEAESAWYCYGHHFMIHTGLRLAFLLAQTCFIFKNHKLVVMFQGKFMKWGLMHVAATNLCIWMSIFVLETAESFAHLSPLPQAIIYDGEDTAPAVFNVTRICHDHHSLADKASPFLYPCVVQTCIIACVGLYRIYKNINSEPLRLVGWKPLRDGGVCHKTNTGLFFGLFAIVAAIISTVFCLMHHHNASPLSRDFTILIYASCHIFILGAALLAVLIGFCRIQSLKLGLSRGMFNEGVLLFSLVGHYALICFLAIPVIASVVNYRTQPLLVINELLFACLNATIVALSFIQSTFQVALIVFGLRMRTSVRRLIKAKPGRSTLTFLMLANIALWLVSSFEVQEIHSEWVFRDFYGELPWQLIVHTCLPLTDLFRFMSVVCLSTVWFNAYRMDQKREDKDTKEVHESQNLL